MTRVFVDTSALMALSVSGDAHHARSQRSLRALRDEQAELVTTSYALVETYALLGRRLGPDAVRAFREDFAPLLQVLWVDATLHDRALDRLLTLHLRDLSLVDAVSLEVIHAEQIDRVFAFDPHLLRDGARAVA
jgi:predicted nucleic acid-binding protein